MPGKRKLTEVCQDLLVETYPPGDRRSMQPLADEIGVSVRFLYYFRNGVVNNPKTQVSQDIYEALTGKDLV